MATAAQIEQIVAREKFGAASAAKRGRNPSFPYVPVIDHGFQARGVHRTRTEQIIGLAYATREEAVAYAAKVIDARRETLRQKLSLPNYRALRAKYGIAECGTAP